VLGPLTGRSTVLAMDVGGSTIKGALVARDGMITAFRQVPTDAQEGQSAVVERLVSFLAGLAADAFGVTGGPAAAAGVALPGSVDEGAGVARMAANIGWRDVPLRGLLEEAAGVPVALRHDVRAAGLAEGRLGEGRGASDYMFVAIGTGIAAAMFVNGRPYPGAHSQAGEIGHVIVDPNGLACGCGGRGCLETIASGPAIAKRYAELAGTILPGGPGAEEILRRASAGELAASSVRNAAVEALAAVLLTCQRMCDFELVVLGGGVSRAGEQLLAPLEGALAARCGFQVPPRLALGVLGVEAGCIGAGLSAWGMLDDLAVASRPGSGGAARGSPV
jgi:glucokinase